MSKLKLVQHTIYGYAPLSIYNVSTKKEALTWFEAALDKAKTSALIKTSTNPQLIVDEEWSINIDYTTNGEISVVDYKANLHKGTK